MNRRIGTLRARLIVLGLGLTGCLDNKLADEPPGKSAGVFLPQTRDFKNFRDWMSFAVADPNAAHDTKTGETTIYLNKLPPDGATAFPVATIVVKTMKPADSDHLTIHAMAKHGGSFNSDGAAGWEYFELALDKHDVPIIVWNGAKAPSGEEYQRLLRSAGAMDDANSVDGDCNSCHAGEGARDGMLGDSLTELLKAP